MDDYINTVVNDAREWSGVASQYDAVEGTEFSSDLNTISSDPNGDPLTYAFVNDDAPWIYITGSTLKADPLHVDVGTHRVEIAARDVYTSSTVTLTTVVEDINHDPVFTSDPDFSMDEDQLEAGSVVAADNDGDMMNYSVSAGPDQGALLVDWNTGLLQLELAPDYEDPQDANGDNIYQVRVRVTDGILSSTRDVSVTILDVNEAPVFTSPSSTSVVEDTTAVITLTATDPEDDTLTYDIAGGADATQLVIDPQSGDLSFVTAPSSMRPQIQITTIPMP